MVLHPNSENGLKKVSTVKLTKIAALDKRLILGKLGHISLDDFLNLDKNLSTLFELEN